MDERHGHCVAEPGAIQFSFVENPRRSLFSVAGSVLWCRLGVEGFSMRVVVADHPAVATVRLAAISSDLNITRIMFVCNDNPEGKRAEAESLYPRPSETGEIVLGPDHPHMKIKLNKRALVFISLALG